jgi:hypothetical protein
MEKFPSSLMTHKRVDAMDTRLAEMEGDLVSNPLERNLGFYDFGKHTTAPGDANYALETIDDMWHEEIQADLNSDDEAEVESDSELEEAEEMETDNIERLKTKRKR